MEITLIITFIGVVFSFMESLSFLFLSEFEANANISVAVKSGSTVAGCFVVAVDNSIEIFLKTIRCR